MLQDATCCPPTNFLASATSVAALQTCEPKSGCSRSGSTRRRALARRCVDPQRAHAERCRPRLSEHSLAMWCAQRAAALAKATREYRRCLRSLALLRHLPAWLGCVVLLGTGCVARHHDRLAQAHLCASQPRRPALAGGAATDRPGRGAHALRRCNSEQEEPEAHPGGLCAAERLRVCAGALRSCRLLPQVPVSTLVCT